MGTTQRLSSLRKACLIRGRYRCVVSRRFDTTEAVNRYNAFGDDAKDDEVKRGANGTNREETVREDCLLIWRRGL
jgi:hypothetical protein